MEKKSKLFPSIHDKTKGTWEIKDNMIVRKKTLREKVREVLQSEEKKIEASSSQILQKILHPLLQFYHGDDPSKLAEIELEHNIYSLVNHDFSYWEIEKILSQLGHSVKRIRTTFKNLFGIDPKDYFDKRLVRYVKSPPEIPTFTPAWGFSKDEKYDYYFIMPYGTSWFSSYTIFGQKGYTTRDIIQSFASLDEAKRKLCELVKEVIEFEEPIREEILRRERQAQTVSSVLKGISQIPNFLFDRKFKPLIQNLNAGESEVNKILNNFMEKGVMTNKEYKKFTEFYNSYLGDEFKRGDKVFYCGKDKPLEFILGGRKVKAFLKRNERGEIVERISPGKVKVKWPLISSFVSFEEEIKNLSKKIVSEEIPPVVIPQRPEEEVKETPSSLFEEIMKETKPFSTLKNIGRIEDYLAEKFKNFAGFSFRIVSFKLLFEETDEEKRRLIMKDLIADVINADAIATIVLEVECHLLSTKNNKKLILLICYIKDDELVVTDSFKGQDDKIYPFNLEGLYQYFGLKIRS